MQVQWLSFSSSIDYSSYTLRDTDYEDQSSWEIIYFTVLVMHEGLDEWMKYASILYQ